MEKTLEKSTADRTSYGALVALASLPSMAAANPACDRDDTGLRLPPTRAARASRSRGVFLEEPTEVMSTERAHWIEVPVAIVALAVAAFALTVCFKASSIVAGPAVGINPGPAIVASASVAPPFVVPLTLR